jgi:hypothetical protein
MISRAILPFLLAFTFTGNARDPNTLEGAPQPPQARGAEVTAIEATLNDYLLGNKEGDVDRLRRAFHPSAEIEGVRAEGFTSWNVDEYVGGMTPGRTREFVPRILAVDFIGNAAQAKVESDYGNWKFVDYMQLLKIEGEWKIVNKIYYRVVDPSSGPDEESR